MTGLKNPAESEVHTIIRYPYQVQLACDELDVNVLLQLAFHSQFISAGLV